MTRQELVEVIRQYEMRCSLVGGGVFFQIEEMVGLADGVLAVRDTDGRYTIYFEKKRFSLKTDSSLEDAGLDARDFPHGIGLIIDVMAKSWYDILETAQKCLEKRRHGEIKWHERLTRV